MFVHPGNPELKPLPGMPQPILDFPMDTTRTALHMVTSGVTQRCPSVRVILSHAGGFLPYAATRFAVLLHAYALKEKSEDELTVEFRKFYFDTALSTPNGLPSLMAFADPQRIVFGADNPYISLDVQNRFTKELDSYENFASGQLEAINRANAELLFPRLRKLAA